jgi:soluble lytic murein transglycosylase
MSDKAIISSQFIRETASMHRRQMLFMFYFVIGCLVGWFTLKPGLASMPETDPDSTELALNTLDLRSYFSDSAYDDLRSTCRDSDAQDCYSVISNAYDKETSPDQSRRLAMVLALRAFDLGDNKSGVSYLRELDGQYPLLQDYIDYYLGEGAYLGNRNEEALMHFEKVQESSRLYLQSRFRIAFCKVRLKSPDAAPLLADLLSQYPTHFRAMEARFELANLIRFQSPERAAELYESVATSRPRAGIGLLAEERLKALPGKPLNPEKLARLRIMQAKTLMDLFQYTDAQKLILETATSISDKLKGGPLMGSLRLELGKAQFKRRQYSDALASFDKAERGPLSSDDKAELLYWRTDAYMRKGLTDKALDSGTRFLKEFASHKHACSLRYMMGKAHKVENRYEQSLPYYRDIAHYHPTCEHTSDALWNVGWLYYKQKDFASAKTAFSRIATSSSSRFERERAIYWLARIADTQGYADYSADLYRLLVERYPLSYYPNLAAQRLLERNRPLPVDYLSKADLSDAKPDIDLGLNVAAYRNEASFAKGIEFLKLERNSEARREFSHLQSKYEGDQTLYLLVAYMYHLAQDWPQSIWLFRTRLERYDWQYPIEGNPRPFKDITVRNCDEFGLDPLLLTALMREESSFQTDVQSFAHAVGLTQIIASTGRHIAKQLGVSRFSMKDLTNPEISIRFGAHHMKELVDRYRGNHALAIAAYNAGETAVNRWQNERGDQPMDEFVEDIPYQETRGYVRRVLKSYGIYRHLYSRDGFGFLMWYDPDHALPPWLQPTEMDGDVDRESESRGDTNLENER